MPLQSLEFDKPNNYLNKKKKNEINLGLHHRENKQVRKSAVNFVSYLITASCHHLKFYVFASPPLPSRCPFEKYKGSNEALHSPRPSYE